MELCKFHISIDILFLNSKKFKNENNYLYIQTIKNMFNYKNINDTLYMIFEDIEDAYSVVNILVLYFSFLFSFFVCIYIILNIDRKIHKKKSDVTKEIFNKSHLEKRGLPKGYEDEIYPKVSIILNTRNNTT